jgi:hypothetical protein
MAQVSKRGFSFLLFSLSLSETGQESLRYMLYANFGRGQPGCLPLLALHLHTSVNQLIELGIRSK